MDRREFLRLLGLSVGALAIPKIVFDKKKIKVNNLSVSRGIGSSSVKINEVEIDTNEFDYNNLYFQNFVVPQELKDHIISSVEYMKLDCLWLHGRYNYS